MSKHWKEAASVIVTARAIFPKQGTSGIKSGGLPFSVPGSDKTGIPIKDVVGTKIEFKQTINNNNFNYKILALQRSNQISFMPDSYVFPGGNIDPMDSSKDWLQLFEQNGVHKSEIELVSSTRTHSKISIFQSNQGDEIPKPISLRIAGIRETFEECGILLCKSKAHSSTNVSNWASYVSGHEIQKWQKKVQENAKEFLNLCTHFQCYPNIWSLQEWSNWLSPTYFPKRYNTVFFVVNLSHMPPTFFSGGEISTLKWSYPQEFVELCEKQKIILPPPQFYELSRLSKFSDIEELASFAASKNTAGSDLWMPVRIKTTDGEVTLLPGDDLYPSKPSYEPSPLQKVEISIEELQQQSQHLHRMEHTKEYNRLVIRNINSSENHILSSNL